MTPALALAPKYYGKSAGWSRKVESLRPCVIATVLILHLSRPVMHVISCSLQGCNIHAHDIPHIVGTVILHPVLFPGPGRDTRHPPYLHNPLPYHHPAA